MPARRKLSAAVKVLLTRRREALAAAVLNSSRFEWREPDVFPPEDLFLPSACRGVVRRTRARVGSRTWSAQRRSPAGHPACHPPAADVAPPRSCGEGERVRVASRPRGARRGGEASRGARKRSVAASASRLVRARAAAADGSLMCRPRWLAHLGLSTLAFATNANQLATRKRVLRPTKSHCRTHLP
jgi:hypothetical protein